MPTPPDEQGGSKFIREENCRGSDFVMKGKRVGELLETAQIPVKRYRKEYKVHTRVGGDL